MTEEKAIEHLKSWGFGRPEILKNSSTTIFNHLTYDPQPGLFLFSDKQEMGNGIIPLSGALLMMLQKDLIKQEIRLIEIPEMLLQRFDEEISELFRCEDSDLVIMNEIAPTKLNDNAILRIYTLINNRVKNKKKFVITSSLDLKEIIPFIGIPLAKLIKLNSVVLELK